MDYKLNDCPFCGGKAEIKYVPNGWSYENMAYVKCAKCGASSKHLDITCREEKTAGYHKKDDNCYKEWWSDIYFFQIWGF